MKASLSHLVIVVVGALAQNHVLVAAFSTAINQKKKVTTPASRHAPPRPLAPHLYMAPRYDPFEERWEPTNVEEEAASGYPPVGSLIRQGPVPFVQRLLNPDKYEQGVLKMMANESMDRNEAQGNMDAYLQNVRTNCCLPVLSSFAFTTVWNLLLKLARNSLI